MKDNKEIVDFIGKIKKKLDIEDNTLYFEDDGKYRIPLFSFEKIIFIGEMEDSILYQLYFDVYNNKKIKIEVELDDNSKSKGTVVEIVSINLMKDFDKFIKIFYDFTTDDETWYIKRKTMFVAKYKDKTLYEKLVFTDKPPKLIKSFIKSFYFEPKEKPVSDEVNNIKIMLGKIKTEFQIDDEIKEDDEGEYFFIPLLSMDLNGKLVVFELQVFKLVEKELKNRIYIAQYEYENPTLGSNVIKLTCSGNFEKDTSKLIRLIRDLVAEDNLKYFEKYIDKCNSTDTRFFNDVNLLLPIKRLVITFPN